MGIKESNGGTQATFVSYSAFLGALTIDNEVNRKLLQQAKDKAGGDTEVKKGFVGLGADTASGKARNFLKENKVPFGFNIDGKLVSAYYKDVEDASRGLKVPYLKVVLQDEIDGRKENTVLSVNLQNELAQKLIQKLQYATPGQHLEIGAWASFEPNRKDPNGKSYSKHNTSVKQDGAELKVPEDVKHYDIVKDLVAAKHQKLIDAGFENDASNKEMFSKARQSTVVEYFKGILVSDIEPRFAAYKDAAKEAVDHDEHRDPLPAEPPSVSDDDSSFDPAAAMPKAA